MTLGNDRPAAQNSNGDAAAPGADPMLRGGDRGSLTAIATELLPRVRNLIRYLIRGDQDVDDIAQEALLAVLRGLPSYRGEGPLESWADRIVARATFAWLRRRKMWQNFEGDQGESEPAAGESTLPDEYLQRRQLVELLDQLPYEQRHALVLHHVLGLRVTEIAEETEARLETVRTRLRLGKSRLRELASNDPEPEELAREHG